MNDGGADPWDNLYAGPMGYRAEAGRADLYRITRAGKVSVVLDDVTVSNGIGFSADGALLHQVELPARLVTACTLGGSTCATCTDAEPEAGALFRVRVDVPGTPVLPYAG